MSHEWHFMAKTKDRKEAIDLVILQAENLAGTSEASLAWNRLCREMRSLSDPEARPPRFAGLLRAVWIAATNEQS